MKNQNKQTPTNQPQKKPNNKHTQTWSTGLHQPHQNTTDVGKQEQSSILTIIYGRFWMHIKISTARMGKSNDLIVQLEFVVKILRGYQICIYTTAGVWRQRLGSVFCAMCHFSILLFTSVSLYQFQKRFSFPLPSCSGLPVNGTVSVREVS